MLLFNGRDCLPGPWKTRELIRIKRAHSWLLFLAASTLLAVLPLASLRPSKRKDTRGGVVQRVDLTRL